METHKEDGTYEIIGCAMTVQNELGFGLREKPYENALAIELRDNGFEAVQQQPFPILYKNQPVGDCIPDLTLPELNILLEIKALDSISESKIQRAIENSFEGRTAFIIAHRLSTIRNADHIIVLAEGAIIEQGDFDTLIKLDAHFAKLWNMQSR